MKKLTVVAASLIATFACTTLAQAGCNSAHIKNKAWKVTAHEATSGDLIYCQFRTSGTGTIAGNPMGCKYSRIGTNTDFNNMTTLALTEGAVAAVPGNSCTYDATLKLGDGSTVLKARVVLEAGKTIANGNFLLSTVGQGAVMTAAGGGTISMMRQ